MLRTLLFFTVALTCMGEVVETSANGFLLQYKVIVPVSPKDAYLGIVNVAHWWEESHTYSGSSKNLSIVAEAGGCFCERLPGGGQVQHMTVVFASPGQLLRMTGALGPLQQHAINGVLSFELKPDGNSTNIAVTYSVGGFFPGGIGAMAAPVDGVLKVQVDRLKASFSGAK